MLRRRKQNLGHGNGAGSGYSDLLACVETPCLEIPIVLRSCNHISCFLCYSSFRAFLHFEISRHAPFQYLPIHWKSCPPPSSPFHPASFVHLLISSHYMLSYHWDQGGCLWIAGLVAQFQHDLKPTCSPAQVAIKGSSLQLFSSFNMVFLDGRKTNDPHIKFHVILSSWFALRFLDLKEKEFYEMLQAWLGYGAMGCFTIHGFGCLRVNQIG